MSSKVFRWTPDKIDQAIAALQRHHRLRDALPSVEAAVGFRVTRSSLDCALAHVLRGTAASHLAKHGVPLVEEIPIDFDDDTEPRIALPVPPAPATDLQFEALVAATKRATKRGQGLTLEALCDELDAPPSKVHRLVDSARAAGVAVDFAHGKLFFRAPAAEPTRPPVAMEPAVAGRHHRIGWFTDLHFGSRYCLRDQFTAFVNRCYDEFGIRDFFCTGDTVEGCYRHATFERSSETQDEQQNEFLDALPHRSGMRVVLIDGNHDYTWTEKNGVESGRNLVRLARERGREDLIFCGSRGALIQYGETRIEMWHPKKGAAYALSYGLQNKIRDTSPARKPHILLTGHTHQYVKVRQSDVWAFYGGTFQHGDAPHGRSLGGDVAMGGTIVDWRIDEDGVVRELQDSFKLAHYTPRTFDVAV